MRRIRAAHGETVDVEGDCKVSVARGAHVTIMAKPSGRLSLTIEAGEGSVVKSCIVGKDGCCFSQTSRVGKSARIFNSCLWTCGAEVTVSSILCGSGAEAHDLHAFVARGREELRLRSSLEHAAEGTKGDILVKGVAGGSASADLGGMIRVGKNGAGAESFLSEHAMLLGHGARASANPELEIGNNDVSSKHSASVSQIDEDELFYLMSRGLGPADARGLIVEGFVGSAIRKVPDASWQDAMMEQVRGALASRM